jgi:hypothetical protein
LPTSQSSYLNCIQEYHHTFPDGPNKFRHFLELSNRSEGFKSEAVNDDDIIHFQQIIDSPSSIQGSVDDCKYLSISVET